MSSVSSRPQTTRPWLRGGPGRFALGSLALALFVVGCPTLARASLGPEQAAEPADDDGISHDLVLIRVTPERPAVRARLQAELGLLGFVSAPLERPADDPALGEELLEVLLEREPTSQAAGAAIEIVLGEGEVELWVANLGNERVLYRRLDAAESDDGNPRTLAIAAVELLRAARIETDAPGPDPDPPDPDPIDTDRDPDPGPEPDPDPPELPDYRVGIGIAPVLGYAQGLSVSAHVELGVRWLPRLPNLKDDHDPFALRMAAWLWTVPARAENNLGTAQVSWGMVFLEPQWRIPPPARAPYFHPDVGVGVGGLLTLSRSVFDDAGQTVDQTSGAFATYGHLGLGFAVTPRLSVHLNGYAGIVAPYLNIQLEILQDDGTSTIETLTQWGPFWAGTSLGIEIWL